jgi:hypothetical protein
VSNYHDIAILSTVGKFFELLVYWWIVNTALLRTGRLSQIFLNTVLWKSNLDGCQVDSIHTNFSKAFYKVHHRLLLVNMLTDVEPSR